MTGRAFTAIIVFRLLLLGLGIAAVCQGAMGLALWAEWRVGMLAFYCISISLVASSLSILVIVPWFDYITPNWRHDSEEDYLESLRKQRPPGESDHSYSSI